MRTILLTTVFTIGAFLTSFSQEPDKPTLTEALVTVNVKNTDETPRIGETVIFAGPDGKSFEGITNDKGQFKLLIPKGITYDVLYRTFGEATSTSKVPIPLEEGKLLAFELNLLFDPAAILKAKRVITLNNVHFDTGKSTLKPESYDELNELVSILKSSTDLNIEISGHTDNVGDDASNMKLSEDRALAVKNYLTDKGIDASRLQSKGYGETKPVATNDTPEGRAQNRRTEIKVL